MKRTAYTFVTDPLLLKEIRTRMRAKTVVVVDNLYILGTCGIVFLMLLVFGNLGEALGWEIGSSLFRTITYAQAVLMFFVSPLVAASAIAGEKEQKTYDTLCVTPVSARRIVNAKLLAALSCFFMLIFVALPMVCISFILGGVAPADLLKAYVYTFLCTATAGAMGLYWSTRFERSIASIPTASACAVLVMIIAPIAANISFSGLSMISPVTFLNALYADAEIPFLGVGCPFWIPGFVFLLLIFLYLVVSSTIRLKFQHERHYVLLRLLTLLFFICLVAFIVGENVRPFSTPAESRQCMSKVLGNFLVILLLFSPWLGANIHVTRSENRQREIKKFSLVRILRALLVKAPGFVVLMLLSIVPFLAVGLQVAGSLNMPPTTVWLVYLGVICLSTMTWTLLSFYLSDRKTKKGQIVGIVVAYVIVALIVIVPAVMMSIAEDRSENGVSPWIQYASLLSPITSIGCIDDPYAISENLKAVVKPFGSHGQVLITSGFYLMTTALLSVLLFLRRKKFLVIETDSSA